MNIKGLLRTIKKIFRIITKVISTLLMMLLILIGGFLLYYFLSIKIYEKKGEEYKPFISLYTIISPSMEPNINVYDVVVDVYVKDMNKIEIGDVITFKSESAISKGLIVTHRVTGASLTPYGIAFTTQGDNNPVPDQAYVFEDQIIGKVLFRIPQLGRVQFFVASKGGWLVVVILPAMGVIIYDVIKLCKLLVLKNKMTGTANENPEDLEKKRELERQRREELLKKLNR